MRARRIRSLDASERTRALTELASQIGDRRTQPAQRLSGAGTGLYERIRELVTNPQAVMR